MTLFRRHRAALALACAAFAVACGTTKSAAASFVLSSNLATTTRGLEAVTTTSWVTSSFGTGTTASTLDAVTLLLANTGGGAAEVDIYTDSLLSPGSLYAKLNQATNLMTSLTQTSFAATGTVNLLANTTYWVVLKATTGSLSWGWTASNVGTGVGFQHTFGTSDDSGATWFTYDTYPAQMGVTANAVGAVPEPGSLLLCGIGASGVALGRLASRRRRHHAAESSASGEVA